MRLSQLVPHGVRRAGWRLLETSLVPKAAHPIEGAGPIVVAGMFSTANGLGESARLCFSALETCGLEPIAFDTSPILGQVDYRFDGRTATRLPDTHSGLLIVHANPPELGRVLLYAGRRARRNWRSVSIWHWETPMRPADWIERADYVDELWFPSDFVRSAMDPPDSVKSLVAFHAVKMPELDRTGGEAIIPRGPIVFTCYADANSSFERKNPIGAAHAFRTAFGDDDGVRLVIKTRNAARRPQAAKSLAAAINGAANVVHIDQPYTGAQMAALRGRTDVLVSLHRAEGFGLPIAEAMRSGTPVIATNWSSPAEFMTPDDTCLVPATIIPAEDPFGVYREAGHVWADPDLETAAKWMRRLAEEPGRAKALADKAMTQAGVLFDPAVYCRKVGLI